MYGLVLRRNGYHVIEADSGAVVALEMCAEVSPGSDP